MSLTYRLAKLSDIPALEDLIALSTHTLQAAYYSPQQIAGALGTVFGVDSQLIHDGTYFVAETGSIPVACGGWSRRKTLYGGDQSKTGPDPLRDPQTEPAMVRAFFVHPDHARHGIGRRLLQLCEDAACQAGFQRLEMIATLAGEPLYHACGYAFLERFDIPLANGHPMPVVRMGK
jgi:GNAT superfamily N-acetyltransferase